MKLKCQFLSHINHLSGAQETPVACDHHTGQYRHGTFPSQSSQFPGFTHLCISSAQQIEGAL